MANPQTLYSFTQGYNLQYPPGCWHDVLTESACKHSSDPPLVCLHQSNSFLQPITQSSSEGCLTWTFEELLRASHAFAQKLAESGIKPGSLIAAFIFNGAEFHIGFRAACELGCAFSSLGPKSLGNSMETKHVLELLKPAVIITPDLTAATKIEVAVPDMSKKALVKLSSNSSEFPGQACEGWQGLEDFITSWDGKDNIADLEFARNLDGISLVIMTNDRTSLPKGCPHTSRNFIPAISSVSLAMALDKEGRRRPVCCQVPLHHISGVLMTLDYHL
jgi:acyl-CoA synthetase (AMP-forming)/AMP-acid ligase II